MANELNATSGYGFGFSPGTFKEEKANLASLFTLNKWQLIVILGIAISGLAAFVNTYNALSGINTLTNTCYNQDVLKRKFNTQFIVTLVLGIVALVVGLLLSWLFRKSSGLRLATLGLGIAGIFGIIYAISVKFSGANNALKLGVSWTAFVVFILFGFLVANQSSIKFD